MRAEEIVDALPGGRLIVLGSLPPEGRDLDLLVPRPEREAIIGALRKAGFEEGRGSLVRFRGCGAEPVEIVDDESLGLPTAEVGFLYDQCAVLPGFRRLVRPGPVATVLLMSLWLIASDGVLTPGRRERLEQALRECPAALTAARAHARPWGASRALGALETARAGLRVGPTVRVAALAERRLAMGANPVRARLAGWRAQLPRRRHGFVVALSGLDGAGKSSQAAALAETLEQLGRGATVAWTRVGWDDELDRFADALRRWLDAPVRALRRGERAPSKGTAGGDPAAWSLSSRLRRRSRRLTRAWTVAVALFNVLAHRRAITPQLREGKAVVCDRYVLDSVVGLRAQYGEDLQLGFARRLLLLLSPSPRASFFLDVPAQTAFARKGEQTIEALNRQAELYRQEVTRCGAVRLDGVRSPEELCAEIARRVWRAFD